MEILHSNYPVDKCTAGFQIQYFVVYFPEVSFTGGPPTLRAGERAVSERGARGRGDRRVYAHTGASLPNIKIAAPPLAAYHYPSHSHWTHPVTHSNGTAGGTAAPNSFC